MTFTYKYMQDEIMTIEEVAKYLKMTPQTIYAWAQSGKIPAVKLGKEWRFRKEWVDNWFNQHIAEQFKSMVQPTPKPVDTPPEA